MGTFTAHLINIKILPYAMIVGKNLCILRMCYLIVDRCVTTVKYVRIVYHNRLSVWIKSCFYIERYSPLDLFEQFSNTDPPPFIIIYAIKLAFRCSQVSIFRVVLLVSNHPQHFVCVCVSGDGTFCQKWRSPLHHRIFHYPLEIQQSSMLSWLRLLIK